jgi:hypothetical protein
VAVFVIAVKVELCTGYRNHRETARNACRWQQRLLPAKSPPLPEINV